MIARFPFPSRPLDTDPVTATEAAADLLVLAPGDRWQPKGSPLTSTSATSRLDAYRARVTGCARNVEVPR